MRAQIILPLTTFLCFLSGFTHSLRLSSNDKKYASYLIKFGYMDRSSLMHSNRKWNVDDNNFQEALKKFQNYVHIDATGALDDATKKAMTLDRCQSQDTRKRRRKRYTSIGHWPKKHITYKIVKYSSSISQKEVDSIIFLAFSVWSNHAGITVTKRNGGRTDIEIRFEDIAPRLDKHIFGNTNSRQKTSVITLNDGVQWSQDFTTGLPNLFQTASHEIGHVLGLGHTDVIGAMMFPVYDLGIKIFSLHEDDIQGIQDIYSEVKAISYPGRVIYKKNANKIKTSYNDFKTHISDLFQKFNPDQTPEFSDLNLPEEFYAKGF